MHLMQAASSVDGRIYSWTSLEPDFDGDDYPGDGTPTDVAIAAIFQQFRDQDVVELPDGITFGDMFYWDGEELQPVAGEKTEGFVLTLVDGVPTWAEGGGEEAFDPATLSLTGWWRASYSGSPWSGVASAGTSGTRNLTEATNPPATGEALNGFTPADFDGTNDKLGGDTGSNLYSASAYSGVALVYVDAITTDDSGNPYLNDGIICSSGTGDFGTTLRSTGPTVDVFHWNGSSYEKASATLSTGAWQLVQWKLESGTLKIRVNSGSWQTASASGGAASLGSSSRVGANYNASDFLDGKLAELMLSNTALSDANFDNIKGYLNSRYGLSL